MYIYILHWLRVWSGRNPTNTLRGLLSTSENICSICFVFGLVGTWRIHCPLVYDRLPNRCVAVASCLVWFALCLVWFGFGVASFGLSLDLIRSVGCWVRFGFAVGWVWFDLGLLWAAFGFFWFALGRVLFGLGSFGVGVGFASSHGATISGHLPLNDGQCAGTYSFYEGTARYHYVAHST